jgi:hypothetical protein
MAGCATSTVQATTPASVTTCSGPSFALSLSSKARGESSPERAAAAFARTNSMFAEPLAGWHVVSRATDVAQLQSGTFRLEAIRVPNGTWQVDAGGCAA